MSNVRERRTDSSSKVRSAASTRVKFAVKVTVTSFAVLRGEATITGSPPTISIIARLLVVHLTSSNNASGSEPTVAHTGFVPDATTTSLEVSILKYSSRSSTNAAKSSLAKVSNDLTVKSNSTDSPAAIPEPVNVAVNVTDSSSAESGSVTTPEDVITSPLDVSQRMS